MKQKSVTRKKYSWRIVGFILIFILGFDITLFKTVTEAISKSDNAVILAILALIVSEEKLLHNFVVLNDDNIKSDNIKVSKKISVLTITSLIVVSSSTALLQKTLEYFNVHINILAIMIITMCVQLIILALINKHIINDTESVIYKFFAD
ncbi:hypothetical protein KII93_02260 [Leuconostoc gelidum subsp. gasicomitatum]|uniref:hypothetical protein n=1 Tax=Leuconostoc gasicomitatum TaxID=115778 RepID=UPI000B7E774A|nr:hypothetical protein [Leuconostoc gasicomitatum]MBZ5947301.1 hypothetical protein [Leuconostoc gasicomitatum]